MIPLKHVEGENAGTVVLYALSTCGWCKRAKDYLNKLGISYDYVDADLVDDKTAEEIEKEVIKWNHKEIYPTLVINGQIGMLATDLEKVKKALNK